MSWKKNITSIDDTTNKYSKEIIFLIVVIDV